jgi:hypothetical protein
MTPDGEGVSQMGQPPCCAVERNVSTIVIRTYTSVQTNIDDVGRARRAPHSQCVFVESYGREYRRMFTASVLTDKHFFCDDGCFQN